MLEEKATEENGFSDRQHSAALIPALAEAGSRRKPWDAPSQKHFSIAPCNPPLPIVSSFVVGMCFAFRGFLAGKQFLQSAFIVGVAVSLVLLRPLSLAGGGLPEPDLVLYGTVRDVSGGLNVRLTAGVLNWTFQPGGAGKTVTLTATLTNINDQFSYVLRIPCETQITGFTASDGMLTLGTTYNRSQVRLDTHPVTFVQAAQQNLTLTSTDRGRIERVDLQVSIGGSALLPENWQLQYFGRTGIDPLADPDRDGMDNLGEFRSGTNPVDPNSVFAIEIAHDALGGPRLTWFSAAGRVYTLRRSQDLLTGFQDLAVNLAATPPLNNYQDGTAVAQGPYFYRVLTQAAGQ